MAGTLFVSGDLESEGRTLKIAVGSDNLGYQLKQYVLEVLKEHSVEYEDFGCLRDEAIDYPDVGAKVAEAVAEGSFERGILICGTGIGMAIVANKVPGVRAAVAHDTYSAERARKSNNAQVLAMGALIIGREVARKVVEAWLPSEFQGGGSAPKVAKIDKLDEKYRLLS